MATFRFHTRVSATPDEVWSVLSDVDRIPEWFPGVTRAVFDGEHRILTLADGHQLRARVITDDPDLRRFQYQFVDGFPVQVEMHLGTIDVLGDPAGALVVYSQQVLPEALAENVGTAVQGGIDGITAFFSTAR